MGRPQTTGVHEAKRSHATYITLLGEAKLSHFVGLKLLSKLANLGTTKKIPQAKTLLKRAPSIPLKFTKMW